MDEAKYYRRHLPPGASWGHEVLFDWDGKFNSFEITEATLEACVSDFLPFLCGIHDPRELYGSGHGCSELALSLLARARERGVALPRGEAARQVACEITRMDHVPRGIDALKRLLAIKDVLSPDPASQG